MMRKTGDTLANDILFCWYNIRLIEIRTSKFTWEKVGYPFTAKSTSGLYILQKIDNCQGGSNMIW